jgi:uncharacterized protein YecA (UPF0149 family)
MEDKYMINNDVRPIEEVDPEFASLVYDIANKKYQYGYRALIQNDQGIYLVPCPVAVEKIGRNDICPCGSGKKFKKCDCPQYH